MSKIGATVDAASAWGSVEEDLIASVWNIIVATRAELLMFCLAMAAYAVLFMQRTAKNPKFTANKLKAAEQDDKAVANVSPKNATLKANAPRNVNPSCPDIAKQITMIRTHAAEKNLQGAFSVFESMEQSGIALNCIMYNTVLDACVECKDLKAAEAWMEGMKKAGMTDVVSFNTLIKAHLQSGSFDRARSLMRVMTSEGMKPNQVTFNEILNAMAGNGARKQMWSIIEEMQVAEVKPNQVTISILLKCLNSYSSQTEVNKSFDLIKSMEESMDEVLLSSVVEACVRIGKPALLESQLKQLQDCAPVTINGAHTYGSLIKAYGHARDLTSIWRCWKEMRSRHIKPTSITLGCMVEAIVSNGDCEGAYDLIHQMQEDEQCRDIVNSIIYCSVLKGFTREKKIDRVWAVYKEMKEHKAELSVVTYNTLIDACARCGGMEHLPTLLEDMKTHGAKPNVITYSTMLKGHCQNGDVQMGFTILEQIKKDPNLKPDEIMYNSLLDGCAQSNLVTEGLRLLDEMQAERIWPSNFTLSILVKLMSRARRLDQAFFIVDDLTQKYKFRPNVHVYTNLMQACVFNQQLPRAVNILEQMVGEGIAPDGRTYAILLRGSMNRGLLEQAVGLLGGALGLPDALPFLQKPMAVCPNLDYTLINEVLGGLADRGQAKNLAVPLLQNIKQHAPKVRIDAATQRKVMSPCVGSTGSGAKGWGKGK
jgi:pentatricopeptide repeat protein